MYFTIVAAIYSVLCAGFTVLMYYAVLQIRKKAALITVWLMLYMASCGLVSIYVSLSYEAYEWDGECNFTVSGLQGADVKVFPRVYLSDRVDMNFNRSEVVMKVYVFTRLHNENLTADFLVDISGIRNSQYVNKRLDLPNDNVLVQNYSSNSRDNGNISGYIVYDGCDGIEFDISFPYPGNDTKFRRDYRIWTNSKCRIKAYRVIGAMD